MKEANTLIGKVFPFYLNNSILGSSYYLYQVVTPGVDENLNPTITFEKIGERTRENDYQADESSMHSGDIIRVLMRRNKKNNLAEYVERELISSSTKKIVGADEISVMDNGSEFPIISMDSGDLISRSIVINLRDCLRWNVYKFFDGKYVDILQSIDKFTVLKIHDEDGSFWLEPINTYHISDVNLEDPIKNFRPYYPTDKFSGKLRNSDLNRAIRAQEWRVLQ